MKPAEIVEDIRAYCQRHANPANVEKYAKYFTDGLNAYGLSKEDFEKKVRELIDEQHVTMKQVLEASKQLVKGEKAEETNFASALLREFADEFDKSTLPAIEKWFQYGITNWAQCDIFCGYLMEPLLKQKHISCEDLAEWRTSNNIYQRRAVPVAMLAQLPIAKSYRRLLKFLEPLMLDSEKKVQQGLGWFLREAWKLRPEETEAFLLKWKDQAPRVIYQYATEKMTTQQKQRFKREKK